MLLGKTYTEVNKAIGEEMYIGGQGLYVPNVLDHMLGVKRGISPWNFCYVIWRYPCIAFVPARLRKGVDMVINHCVMVYLDKNGKEQVFDPRKENPHSLECDLEYVKKNLKQCYHLHDAVELPEEASNEIS